MRNKFLPQTYSAIVLGLLIIFSGMSTSCSRKACPAQTHEYEKKRFKLFDKSKRNKGTLFPDKMRKQKEGKRKKK